MYNNYFSEAVFSNGKNTLKPVVDKLDVCKTELMEAISSKKKGDKFNPTAYWKSKAWKDVEDALTKVFGFRHVEINPFIEKYNSDTGNFESKMLYGAVYFVNRYPIDGLVTDSGFYDKTHSLVFDIRLSLGLIKLLSTEEIMAVLLHEIGHNIDPACVDIKYAQANTLSKYLTDRKIDKKEEKALAKIKKDGDKSAPFLSTVLFTLPSSILSSIKSFLKKLKDKNKEKKEELNDKIFDRKLERVRRSIRNDKDEFNRQNFGEAFADNFARMYGYGPQLISGIKKMSHDFDKKVMSRYEFERMRQNFIISITEDIIKDCHKSDIHRIHSLLKECKEDLNDPNIPAKVKKDIQSDMEELEKLLDAYQKDFSHVQNRVNQVINEELEKIEDSNSSDKDDNQSK